jgi:hypothetical protein
MPSFTEITCSVAFQREGGLSDVCDFFRTFFLDSRTAQMDRPIVTVDGSNDSFWCKEVPFLQKGHLKFYLGDTIPSKWGPSPWIGLFQLKQQTDRAP